MPTRILFVSLAVLALSCGKERVVTVEGGTVKVTVLDVDSAADDVAVQLSMNGDDREVMTAPRPPVVLTATNVPPGTWQLRVSSHDKQNAVLQTAWVSGVVVERLQETDLVVDLAGAPKPAEICDGKDNDGDGRIDEPLDLGLCTQCANGTEALLPDDPRCGPAPACGPTTREVRGDNTAQGATKSCVELRHDALPRCQKLGECVDDAHACQTGVTELLTAPLCQTILGCTMDSTPRILLAPDGTSCGTNLECHQGQCQAVVVTPTVSVVGCSDGTREGFQNQTAHPGIAACSGGWSVPGVTRANLAPACNRGAGNTSSNPEGQGCAAADLCAAGWHVCNGAAEVAQRAPSGCGDAVPTGTPDKSLFFAVAQRSTNNTVCDAAGTGDNDVFGCGNLGTELTAAKQCGVLTRALASMQPQHCGYNEAEPSMGPWECLGGTDSHLHEGALVTKKACAGNSCSYSGQPVGTPDKGGVLCCVD